MSRTDLDFEQALHAEGTVVLKEGIDVNSLGVESPGPLNRSYSSSYSTPSTPVNRSISRIPLQPPTPIVVPPSPSPVVALSASSMSNPMNGGRYCASNAGSKAVPPSPSTSSQDLEADTAEEAERQTHRRSMYRASGTSSSPDLATLLRKARERGGTVSPSVGALGRKDRRRDEPPPPLPDLQPLRYQPLSYTVGESSRDTPSSPTKQDGTVKVCLFIPGPLFILIFRFQAPRSSVRAKTSAFFGKMLGQTVVVRERSVRKVTSSFFFTILNGLSEENGRVFASFVPSRQCIHTTCSPSPC